MQIVKQSATLLSMTPASIFLIERAGRVCYKSEGKGDCSACGSLDQVIHNFPTGRICPSCVERAESFIRKLIDRGHESVLEHASATFLFVTDRGVTHELVRHRLCAFSQESTRYCAYDDGIQVIQPLNIKEGTPEFSCWLKTCETIDLEYRYMLDRQVPAQWARSVLPTCLKTEIVCTANFRQIRHMIKLRTSEAAHPQIRDLFQQATARLRATLARVIFS